MLIPKQGERYRLVERRSRNKKEVEQEQEIDDLLSEEKVELLLDQHLK